MQTCSRQVKERELTDNELCTEQEISNLVRSFYARVRQDEMLAPIFDAHIEDWDQHQHKLVDFWSTILRRTGRFTGAPMPRHVRLPGLSAELFRRWLALFRETTAAQPNKAMGEQAQAAAERIAHSLWMGYQMSRNPDAVPAALADG